MAISRATGVRVLLRRNATHRRSVCAAFFVLLLIAGFSTFAAAASLDDELRDPAQASLPWCYWYWLDDGVTAEGITRDLESMARTGIARAMIGNICIDGGYSDQIGGEFWSSNPLGQVEYRAASSAVHIYDKRTVYTEAFTSRLNLADHPYTI